MKKKKDWKQIFRVLEGACLGAIIGGGTTQFFLSGCTDPYYLILAVFALVSIVSHVLGYSND